MVVARTLCVALLAVLASGARASCTSLPAAVTQPMVERVMMNAGSLLEQNRDGDSQLGASVATVLQANSRLTLQPILKLAGRANARQKMQIGRGIASAISACRRFEPETTRTLERATRDITDRDVLAGLSGPRGGSSGSSPGGASGSTPNALGSAGSFGGTFGSSSGRPAQQPSGRIGQRDLKWDPFAKQALPGSVAPIAPMKSTY